MRIQKGRGDKKRPDPFWKNRPEPTQERRVDAIGQKRKGEPWEGKHGVKKNDSGRSSVIGPDDAGAEGKHLESLFDQWGDSCKN